MAPNLKASGVVIVCILSLVVGIVESEKRDYAGFSVIRCQPKTVDQVEKLRTLMVQTNEGEKVQFWTEPIGPERSVDMSVDPEYKDTLDAKLDEWDIPCKTMIKDLGQAIRRSSPTTTLTRAQLSNSTMRELYLSAGQYHQRYHRYSEIEAKLRELARDDPRMSIEVIGKSSEGRNLYLVRISNDPAANKPVILMDAGHHAREWISHSTIIYLIETLLNIDVPRISANLCRTERCRQTVRSNVKLNLDEYDYWFVPVVNPDGYEYSHTSDRLWRKTRSSNYCKGVDANRNYPFHWGESGVSQFACSEIYAGRQPLSEPEVKAMTNVMDNFKYRIVMYISFHSYSQLILAPYGYKRIKPSNYADMERVANGWIRAMADLRNTSYQFGTSSFVLYPAAGCADDYAHGYANIKYSYTIELPDTGLNGFILPPSEIIPVGHEAAVGLRAMIEAYEKIK